MPDKVCPLCHGRKRVVVSGRNDIIRCPACNDTSSKTDCPACDGYGVIYDHSATSFCIVTPCPVCKARKRHLK